MLQKALLSVTARERAQLWGFRLPGRWGIIQKALISATAHEDMQKPFDFAIFGRQWRVCVTGQVSVTKRAAFRKGIYNLAKIPNNDRISTQDETKTKNGLFCMVVAILAYKGEPLRKKHCVPQGYLKPYTSSDSFRN